METEQEQIEREIEESRMCALDIEEGMRSRYWKHIETKLKGLIEARKIYQEILNKRLIRLPEDVDERNDLTKCIAILEQMLKINETIRDEKLSLITNAKMPIPDNFKRPSNFVGGNHDG